MSNKIAGSPSEVTAYLKQLRHDGYYISRSPSGHWHIREYENGPMITTMSLSPRSAGNAVKLTAGRIKRYHERKAA